MKSALEKEIKLSKDAGDGTYTTDYHGTLPALTFSAYNGCDKRSTGRRYDSASIITNMIGGYAKNYVSPILVSIISRSALRLIIISN